MIPLATAILVGQLAAVSVALVSAVTDWRRGEIPNWLTLPPLVIGPLFWFLAGGAGVTGAKLMINSLAGIFFCGLVPYLLFRKGAIGGGDVKIVAAMGALAGLYHGLEFALAGFLAAGVYALGRLAWEGKLLRTLGNSLFLALNPLMPKAWRREVTPESMATVRMGGAFFVGAAVATLSHYPQVWS
ncbi:MAG: prepilin peptidase [Myxococcales bacterium]|nr:prepilin peptidase [Myxococcales bacterium]